MKTLINAIRKRNMKTSDFATNQNGYLIKKGQLEAIANTIILLHPMIGRLKKLRTDSRSNLILTENQPNEL